MMWDRIRSILSTFVLVGLITCPLEGCGDELPEGTVPQLCDLEEVPQNVISAAKNALPGVTFKDAWKNVDGRSRALHSYEIRGTADGGKTREVRVSSSGQILEME